MSQPLKLDDSQIHDIRERCKDNMYLFIRGVLGFDWLVPHVHLPLCEMASDPEITRGRVVFPRGWLKSTVMSIGKPIWHAINNPDIRCLIAQNTHTNAKKKLQSIDAVFRNNQLFRALFPELLPNKNNIWNSESMSVNRKGSHAEGTFEAAGTQTAVTSRHYNLIIEDDTISPDKDELSEINVMPSMQDVDQAIGWHRLVLPLLTNPQTDQNWIVGTRWFEKDLISWSRENEPYFVEIERAVRELDGKPDEAGEVTYPERFSESVLEQLQASMGPYLYSCLYMNKPVRSNDMVFLPEWFSFYDKAPRDLICYTTVDPAGDPETSKGEPDWNVVITTGKNIRTGDIYVLDVTRGKLNPGQLIQAIFDHAKKWSPVKVGIEAVQYQKSLLYWINERMQKTGDYFYVEPITHGRRSKNQRILGLQPVIQSGRLMFRRAHEGLISEAIAFPLGKNDDQIDALSMQVDMWGSTIETKERDMRPEEMDIFSLDRAIWEIDQRRSVKRDFIINDIAQRN